MKRNFSKLLSVTIAVLMLISAVPFSVNAAVMASGKCGENLTWTLDSEGTLTISGTGSWYDEEYDNEVYTEYHYYDQYKQQVKKVIITDGVTGIGIAAFNNFRILESVSIPESVTYIGNKAFMECLSLNDITLPQSLLTIGEYVFMQTPLKALYIPANVKNIRGPLVIHANFEGYTVDENNKYFSVDENGNLFNKAKTKLIHLRFDPTVKEYTVPDSVTTIGRAAFTNFYLEKIIIPETVTVIEESAFAGTFCLKEINLPKHLKKLCCFMDYGEISFVGLEKLTIPEVDSFICSREYEEDDSGVIHTCNHYKVFNYNVLISEITVYDRDMDFSEITSGLTNQLKFKPDGLKIYREAVRNYYADTYSYYFGYGTEIGGVNINEDEIFIKDAEADFIINGENYYKIPGFTVRCYPGSTAEEYAKKYDFNIKYICDEHTEEILPAKFPTCTETGLTEGKKCSVCDEILEAQKTVEAKGHDYKAAVTNPTCTAQGFTTYTCSCGDSYVSDYVNAKGHSYKSEITEEPGCKTAGEKLYFCECGDSYTESIPAAGHKDNDNNNACDNCGVVVCDHLCHKTGFLGFIWKIINFFGKLFGTNPVCECGMAHY